VLAAVPHATQNRLPGGFSLLQVAHRQGSGAPQSPQNFSPPAAVAPQRRQIIRFPFPESPACILICCDANNQTMGWFGGATASMAGA
jgi:hypothetical protein